MTSGRQRRATIRKGSSSLFVPLFESLVFLIVLSTTTLILPSSAAMRIVVQRVKSASVTVDGDMVVSSIGPGILALVGLHEHDTIADAEYCSKKLLACKLWENESGGQWRQGVKQKGYELLCVSQFTLYGTLSKKNQPDYKLAMKSVPAEKLYRSFLAMVREQYETEKVQDGKFGEMMDVALVNDGPVTLVIESDPKAPETVIEESSA
jgi:D-tyrosyl-tRNA(Tyr) deacylase